MNKQLLTAVVAIAGALVSASGASANPIYIGLQEAGTNSGNITNESGATGGSPSTSFNGTYGTFSVSVTATGTPTLPEPDLLSVAVDISTSSAGTLDIYVSALNEMPLPIVDFDSAFTSTTLPAGWTVEEVTYAQTCVTHNPGCGEPGDVFQTTNLLSEKTFTSTGSVEDLALPPAGLTKPYSETEEYIITTTGSGSTKDSIGLSVPEPASLAVFGTALVGLGLFGWRRRNAQG